MKQVYIYYECVKYDALGYIYARILFLVPKCEKNMLKHVQ